MSASDKKEAPSEEKKEKPRKRKKALKHPIAFIRKQKANLFELRDQLTEAMYGVQQEAIRSRPDGGEASGNGVHQGDAGSDSFDRDLALSILAKEQNALQEIEGALERMESGTYGICEMSGVLIPQERLEVIPFTRYTMACQRQLEATGQDAPKKGEVGFGAFSTSTNSVLLDDNED